MRLRSTAIALLLLCALALSTGWAQTPAKRPVAHGQKTHTRSKHHRRRRTSWKRQGQQHIDAERARDIQEALIRDKYLEGEPSGLWDARTKQAMSRYQSDHGWQTKVVPDSRALITLGLGPSHDHLLNPESAPAAGGPEVNRPRTEKKD